jgi:toxin YoeB
VKTYVVRFSKIAEKDIDELKKRNDLKSLNRIPKLISSIVENPFKGLGKPEPLKYNLSGLWS